MSIPHNKLVQAAQIIQSVPDGWYCWIQLISIYELPLQCVNIQKLAKLSSYASLVSAMRQRHCTAALNPSDEYRHLVNEFVDKQDPLKLVHKAVHYLLSKDTHRNNLLLFLIHTHTLLFTAGKRQNIWEQWYQYVRHWEQLQPPLSHTLNW